jgi:hypothetical protein
VPREVNKQKFEILFQSYLSLGLQNKKVIMIPSVNLIKKIEFDKMNKPLSRVEVVKGLIQLKNRIELNEPIDKRFKNYWQLNLSTDLESNFNVESECETKYKQDSLARCYLLASYFMEQLNILKQKQTNVK